MDSDSRAIPDSWPPTPPREPAPVPVFPLPEVFLFPRQELKLHVFEPRYRQMIEDLLDGPGRLVVGTLAEPPLPERDVAMGEAPEDSFGEDPNAAPPPMLSVAGLGEICGHRRTPDGRFFVRLLGLGRVVIREVASERLYRKVTYERLHETPSSETDSERLRKPLLEAIQSRSEQALDLGEEMPTSLLSDILSVQILSVRFRVPQAVMEDIYSESHVTRRALKVLAAHRRYPAPRR